MANERLFTKEPAMQVQLHLRKNFFQSYEVELKGDPDEGFYVSVGLDNSFRLVVNYKPDLGWYTKLWKENKNGDASKRFGQHYQLLLEKEKDPSDTKEVIRGLNAALFLFLREEFSSEIFDEQKIQAMNLLLNSFYWESKASLEAEKAKAEIKTLKQKDIQKNEIQKEIAERIEKDRSDTRKAWGIAIAVVLFFIIFVFGTGDGCYTTYDGEMVCN